MQGNPPTDNEEEEMVDEEEETPVSDGAATAGAVGSDGAAAAGAVGGVTNISVSVNVVCPLTPAERLLFILISLNPALMGLLKPWMVDIYIVIHIRGMEWIAELFRQ